MFIQAMWQSSRVCSTTRTFTFMFTFTFQGLLSYTDFHFLLLLMSTPTRYLDIIFRGFDISADGNVEAKVVFNAHNDIKLGKRYFSY